MITHYPYLLNPTQYPDYERRRIKPPTWSIFGQRTQFTCLRGFTIENEELVGWREDLDLYTVKFRLGNFIWPVFHTIFAKNFKDLIGEIKSRKLYLFDIFGHVPGSSLEGMWSHVMPPAGMVPWLEQELGDHFLGFDNGEQDGRYVARYVAQQCPSPHDRFRQYLNFQRHFERMCGDLGNHMTSLVSLCFGHYFLKEGNHVLLGAETAQSLLNSQVYYAFIRGACKQYGVHWFGNASVYNRWGYKSYEAEGVGYGPRKGTSLNLLRRLLYTHFLYNSVAVGFEWAWIEEGYAEDKYEEAGDVSLPARDYHCCFLKQTPAISGRADDPAWESVPAVEGFYIAGLGKIAVAKPTLFKIGWTKDALYLFVRCDDSAMDEMRCSHEDGENLWEDDSVEFFLTPAGQSDFHQFIINGAGARWNGRGTGGHKLGTWRVKICKEKYSWSLEAEIPFAFLEKTPLNGERWTFNLGRTITTGPDSERSVCWSSVKRGFGDKACFDGLVFRNTPASLSEVDALQKCLNAPYARLLENRMDCLVRVALPALKKHGGQITHPVHRKRYERVMECLERLQILASKPDREFSEIELALADYDKERSAGVILPILSPVGETQASAVRFIAEHGQPGIMHAPVALLLDHFAGWTVPRHMYGERLYQVWGNMPYEAGDYLMHGLLSMLYPGYENSSYFHDERGYLSPTPYGDMTDCLLSDVPEWVLKQYGVLVAAGELMVDDELRDKVTSFVTAGGHFVATAENACKLWPQWRVKARRAFPAGSIVRFSHGIEIKEENEFELYQLELPPEAMIMADCNGFPAVASVPGQMGMIMVLLSPLGVNKTPIRLDSIRKNIDQPLDCPFKLLDHIRHALGQVFESQRVFSVGDGLGYITCRKNKGEYLVGIYNNRLSAQPFKITSHAGSITNVRELLIDQAAKQATGYWPENMKKNDGGVSDAANIAGGDIRLFQVTIKEKSLSLLAEAAPPPRPANCLLAYRGLESLKETILRWPTFFQHFDGVKIEWKYLLSRDVKQLEREKDWLLRNKVRLIVDFSAGLNFYPDLTLLDTLDFRYRESKEMLADVLAKMRIVEAADAVISLHRKPENHCDDARAEDRFQAGVRNLCQEAGRYGITMHLQHHPVKWRNKGESILKFIDAVNVPNLRFALNAGHALMSGESLELLYNKAAGRIGLILASAPAKDRFGQYYDAHLPVCGSGLDLHKCKAPVVLDADYADWNMIYQDIKTLWSGLEKKEVT